MYRLTRPQATNNRFAFLVKPAVTHLGKTKDLLENQYWMFAPGANFRFGPIARPILIRQQPVATFLVMSKVLRLRGHKRIVRNKQQAARQLCFRCM